MMEPLDFSNFISDISREHLEDKCVLTRLLLNTVFDSASFPVDLSELRHLKGEFRAIAWAMLGYAHASPRSYTTWSDRSVATHLAFLQRESAHD